MNGIIYGSIVSMPTEVGATRYKVLNNTPNTLFKGRLVHIDSDSVVYATRDPLAPLEAEGIIMQDIDPYLYGYVQREGAFKLKDWTVLTGNQFLTQGDRYYLTLDGLLTNVPQTLTSGLCQGIGTAIDQFTIDLEIEQSIMIQ